MRLLTIGPRSAFEGREMKDFLKISNTFSMPADLLTQTQAILAKKGVGKSYTASVQAEEMLKLGMQIVAIDITGAWYGLRSSADGKKAGYSILIAGGDNGDIPLDKNAGELMATSIVKEGFSCILDMSLFRKGEAITFLGDFLSNLYRLNRNPLHLFADEADFYAPQKPFGNEAYTLGAMDDVVRRGRKHGIGITLITQRPAVLNKNVLTQCEILTTLRLVHPKDINAIKEWVDVHGDLSTAKEMIESLPSLPIGTTWIWAPGWPDSKGIFERVKIRERQTFDSGATPKQGEKQIKPRVLAQIDIEKLGEKIKATAGEAKENDPQRLKKRIKELEAQQKKPSKEIKEKIIERKVEVPVLSKKEAELFKAIYDVLIKINQKWVGINKLREQFKSPEIPRKIIPNISIENSDLNKCERAILEVLDNHGSAEIGKIALLSGYRISGGFRNSLSSLRQKGFINGENSGQMSIMLSGSDQGPFNSMPTDMLSYWKNHSSFGACEKKIIETLEDSPLELEALATASGYQISGGFRNSLSKLRTAGVIVGRNNEQMRLNPEICS